MIDEWTKNHPPLAWSRDEDGFWFSDDGGFPCGHVWVGAADCIGAVLDSGRTPTRSFADVRSAMRWVRDMHDLIDLAALA